MSHSPLNNSISKQLYSFAKSQRFKQPNQSKCPCKQSFYNIKPMIFTNRATSFGYGNKINFINKQQIPSPGTYQNIGQFKYNSIKKRGYSFTRHKNRSIINQEENIKLPAPNQYQIQKNIQSKYQNIKFSFRSKYQSIFDKNINNLGPGQYNTIQLINKFGRHNVANYQNSRTRSFTKSPRFQQIRSKTPGPGNYNDQQKISMNKTGSYFNSRFKSNNSNLFGKSNRPPLGPKTISPGPGIYQVFSQFNTIKH